MYSIFSSCIPGLHRQNLTFDCAPRSPGVRGCFAVLLRRELTNCCNFQTCYVSQDFSKEMEEFTESDSLAVDMSEFDLPSGDK